jgi:hypothetical protein
MIHIAFDFADVERLAKSLGAAADQVPYAMSVALTEATEKTRRLLAEETWGPKHGIKVRNRSFMNATLTARGVKTTKYNLESEITEREAMRGRGHLMMHAKGGVRTPQHGRTQMAIPVSSIPRTGRGVPARLRPKTMGTDLFRLGSANALYTRDRKGKLKLMYVLKTATPIPRRVPFFQDYETNMARELKRSLPAAVEKAMRTRIVR